MSIAWGSLVLLIILLPGVLFFVGIYWPEQFTREAEQRSPLGQLAGILLAAFVVRATFAANSVCGSRVACISIAGLIRVINTDPAHAAMLEQTSVMLTTYRWWILGHVAGTSFLGILLGAIYGWLVTSGHFQRLTRHPWIYDLSTEGLTYAYVMTNIIREDRILMYRGFLRAFGLQQDGRFSYVVLRDVSRFYMRLGESVSETSGLATRQLIGGSQESPVSDPSGGVREKHRVRSYFVVEGDDVANVVFDLLAFDAATMTTGEFNKIVREEAADLGVSLTSSDERALKGHAEGS